MVVEVGGAVVVVVVLLVVLVVLEVDEVVELVEVVVVTAELRLSALARSPRSLCSSWPSTCPIV